MVIKGKISSGGNVSLNCCNSCTDVLIDGESLYSKIDEYFGLDPEDEFNGRSNDKNDLSISYVILDEEKDMDSVPSEDFKISKIYTSLNHGCYSEYTCGFGGYEYFLENEFDFLGYLSENEGKYLIFQINHDREVLIDQLLR